MSFYDFLDDLPYYAGNSGAQARMQNRYRFLIEPFEDMIEGARVLDLAAHDGRWSYAFAGAGAREVVGIEYRQELIDQFGLYPDADLRARVDLRQGDIFRGLEQAIADGEVYDIVAVFGIYYHIMDHMRLLELIRGVKPNLVILDSEFVQRNGPVIQLVRESTDNVLNAAPQIEGQKMALKGIPSFQAMEAMAEAQGFDLLWSPWETLPKGQRQGVKDYFNDGDMRRATCVLEPRQ